METRYPIHVANYATMPNAPLHLAPAIRITDKIAKPRAQWTVDDLTALVREEKVRIISLMHIGSDGWLKTLDFAPRDARHLRDVLLAGERADGSSIFAGMGIPAGKSDIVLRPRLDSAFFDPFSPVPTLILMCNHYGRDGNRLPESPDTILNNANC
ncbi:MAG: glutamine synthetase beta-grasp domain-containing protein [bacterium]|nr:glutamine synthetase beta-grasp domain-containing protein [bacterium]